MWWKCIWWRREFMQTVRRCGNLYGPGVNAPPCAVSVAALHSEYGRFGQHSVELRTSQQAE